jgi:hypothetical protein
VAAVPAELRPVKITPPTWKAPICCSAAAPAPVAGTPTMSSWPTCCSSDSRASIAVEPPAAAAGAPGRIARPVATVAAAATAAATMRMRML